MNTKLSKVTEKDEKGDYKGDELGEDILAIPLDDPAANAAALKIQVCSRSVDEAIYGNYTSRGDVPMKGTRPEMKTRLAQVQTLHSISLHNCSCHDS